MYSCNDVDESDLYFDSECEFKKIKASDESVIKTFMRSVYIRWFSAEARPGSLASSR